MTLWKKLKRASEDQTGIQLSPEEVARLMTHILSTVTQQCHFDDMADHYDSVPEREK